jgi:hypothetical protein
VGALETVFCDGCAGCDGCWAGVLVCWGIWEEAGADAVGVGVSWTVWDCASGVVFVFAGGAVAGAWGSELGSIMFFFLVDRAHGPVCEDAGGYGKQTGLYFNESAAAESLRRDSLRGPQ